MNFITNSIEMSKYCFIVLPSLVVVVHGTLGIAKKTNFNISLLQIGAKLYHKLGNFFIANWGKSYYEIGATSFYYKLGQLHFITNWGKCCYKLGQLLQIEASFITN